MLATYEAYGQSGDAVGESVPETTEASTETANTGQVLSNPVVENVEALDSTSQEWGQGVNMDEKNRPTGALMLQEKYGKYSAYFIGEESQTIYLTFDEGYEY